MGSFIAGFFTAPFEKSEEGIKKSLFVRVVDKVLNGFPKPFAQPPPTWQKGLAKTSSNSWMIHTLTDNFDTPIPPSGEGGIKSVVMWGLFALPVWGMAVITLTAPIIPTMMLAGLLLPVLFFLLLSRTFEVNHLAVFLLLFIIVNMMAGFMSFTPRASIEIALLVSLFMLAAIAVPACCRSQKSVDFFFLIFLAGAGVTGLVGIWQVFAGYATQTWIDLDAFTDISLRVFSTLGNPNVYGTYLLLAIPLAAACVVFLKHPFLKLCAAGLTVLLLINLVLTFSRGCYLALALAAGIFVLIIEKRFVILFIPAILALPFVLPPAVLNRLMSVINFADMDTSTVFRLNIWRGTIRILQDFWMTGIGQGIGAYNMVYPYYALAAVVSPHSHNLFLQIFVELGIVGLVVFICILACFFRTMVNFMRHATEFRLRVMGGAMIAAVIGFLFQGIFDYVFYNYRVQLTFYIFIGLCMAFAKVYGKARD